MFKFNVCGEILDIRINCQCQQSYWGGFYKKSLFLEIVSLLLNEKLGHQKLDLSEGNCNADEVLK